MGVAAGKCLIGGKVPEKIRRWRGAAEGAAIDVARKYYFCPEFRPKINIFATGEMAVEDR